ncbi:S24 family peptidase [Flavobacterium daejeonense]|uniref:S24 family peptidase n=1 Tax=Flavobacterium daejeonense TaxID=350893 RepID=UPI00068D0DB6|nr:S24 family peptidase [Flavobacterium daejeonense]
MSGKIILDLGGGFFVIDEGQAADFAAKYFPHLEMDSIRITNKLSPKILVVAPNKRLSWQYHFRRAEIWKIVAGIVGVKTSLTDKEGDVQSLVPGDYIHVPVSVDCDIAFPTFGHSMYPEISNGDKVGYKFIKDWSFFNYGMKYLIVTEEQRMVKYLKRSTIEGNVLLTSRNEDYEDIEMPVSSIRSILQVRYICKTEM